MFSSSNGNVIKPGDESAVPIGGEAIGREPQTLQQAKSFFADFDNCQRFLIDLRWPDGKVRCSECGSDQVGYLARARLWKCYGKHDRAKFSLKVGTIFEDSPLGLDKWLLAIWMLVNGGSGIGSTEIARGLAISEKSASRMMTRIQFALRQAGSKAAGCGSA